MFILKLINHLDQHKVKYAICGGYAVALHGAVRGTVDIDLVISLNLEQISSAELALQKMGLFSRIPVTAKEIFQFRFEYMQKKNLFAWSFVNPKNPVEVVDILLTFDLSDLKREKVNYVGKDIWILDKKSLIKTKENTGRKQDQLDIDSLKKL
jgi:hypothetical protein